MLTLMLTTSGRLHGTLRTRRALRARSVVPATALVEAVIKVPVASVPAREVYRPTADAPVLPQKRPCTADTSGAPLPRQRGTAHRTGGHTRVRRVGRPRAPRLHNKWDRRMPPVPLPTGRYPSWQAGVVGTRVQATVRVRAHARTPVRRWCGWAALCARCGRCGARDLSPTNGCRAL